MIAIDAWKKFELVNEFWGSKFKTFIKSFEHKEKTYFIYEFQGIYIYIYITSHNMI